MFYPFIEANVFRERCQLLLNHPRECNTPTRILVYGMLGGLATELAGFQGTMPERYQELAQLFFDKLETAIGDLRLIAPPSRERIEALQVAVRSLI